jgi:hypothetical protein
MGEVTGHGTLDATVVNGGRVSPATGGIAATRTFAQDEAGTLLTTALANAGGEAGDAPPALTVSEGATIAGALCVRARDDGTIDCIDDIPIVRAASVAGRFAHVELDPNGCGPALAATYGGASVRLDLGPAPATADVDCDGLVTEADVIAVLGAWGTCPAAGCCPADVAPRAGGDGVVDEHDLAAVLEALAPAPP